MKKPASSCPPDGADAAAEAELQRRNIELTELNERLTMAQEQLLQSEKLASIGQLAAGVAHEINNPISYVFSNFATLGGYIDGLLAMLAAYQKAEAHIGDPLVLRDIRALRGQVDLDFVSGDIPVLMSEPREGIERVRKIVQDLKDFSRADAHQEFQWSDLHHGIDSTLNIVSNEVKYKADVVKEYGDIPDVECLPSQLNQVGGRCRCRSARIEIDNTPGQGATFSIYLPVRHDATGDSNQDQHP